MTYLKFFMRCLAELVRVTFFMRYLAELVHEGEISH